MPARRNATVAAVLMLLLAACSADTSSTQTASTAAVNDITDNITSAVAHLDPNVTEATTSECPSNLGDFGSGEHATSQELDAPTDANPDLLDAVIAALPDAKVVNDRPLQDPVTGTTTGRAVDLTVDTDSINVSIASTVDNGQFFATVESTCG